MSFKFSMKILLKSPSDDSDTVPNLLIKESWYVVKKGLLFTDCN